MNGTPQEKIPGVIRDVWYGRRSLAQTFWGWGVLFNVLLVQNAGPFAIVMLTGGMALELIAGAYILLVLIPTSIWVIVGLWRSATNHPSFWAVVVKVLIVAIIALNIALFVWSFGIQG